MSAANLQVGNVGSVLRFTVLDSAGAAFALTGATVLKVRAKKPDGSLVEWDGVLTVGSEGSNQFEYVTQTGDLDQPGRWKRQGYFEVGSFKLFTSWVQMPVRANLEA